MTQKFISELLALYALAKASHVRYPVIIRGDDDFLFSLLNVIPHLTLVSDTFSFEGRLTWKQTRSMLGQDIGSLAIDIRTSFDVEKLCLISGCIKGGELLILLVNSKQEPSSSRFRKRLVRFFDHPDASLICQSGKIQISKKILPLSPPPFSFEEDVKTHEQIFAIHAIKHVLSGHRRRPALLVSDRGRGKSAAMGMAAASIMSLAPKRILVVSSLFSHVETLFNHALKSPFIKQKNKFCLQGENGSEMQFMAPDLLLNEKPTCDLLLVDEAAAIPLPMLEMILNFYSRIAFSSTEHGYEGSGRAFSLRFRSLLDINTPGWKEVKLETPIRWGVNDPLESWLFDVFLFDVAPLSVELPFQRHIKQSVIKQIDKDDLLVNEPLLRQLFSLLVTAHYQTSPNDLVMLLDEPFQVLFGAFCGDTLVGVLVAQREGGFDIETAKAVVQGKRRLKGHLLAQSLASHTGVIEALTSTILRIVRIAVLPECTNQGIGGDLVDAIEIHGKGESISFIGTSFGVTQKLWRFWSGLGFVSVRLGVQKDASSGTFSLQLLKSFVENAHWISDLRSLFHLNFIFQLSGPFQHMDVEMVAKLFYQPQDVQAPSDMVMQQVRLFSEGALGYDLVVGSLHTWFVHWLANAKPQYQNPLGCHLLIARLFQKQSWNALGVQFKLQGRKEIETRLRGFVHFALNMKK